MRRFLLVASVLCLIAANAATQPTGLRDPGKKDVALQMLNAAENGSTDWRSGYAHIEYSKDDIDDENNRGYSGGIIGFTSRDHDMLVIVRVYSAAEPNSPLAKFLPALEQVVDTVRNTGLGKAFEDAWKDAAKDPKFQKAQMDEFNEEYFEPAMKPAEEDGVHALGQYIYLDIVATDGDGDEPGCLDAIRTTAAKQTESPAHGGDEKKWLLAILRSYRVAMLVEDKKADTTRIDTMALPLVEAGNLELDLPLKIKVGGENFAITK